MTRKHSRPRVSPGQSLAGQRFGRLLVVACLGLRPVGRGGQRQRFWLCRCDCGKETELTTAALTTGNTRSCDCLRRERVGRASRRRLKHGMTGTPEYLAWIGMKDRCCNPRNAQFKDYGGRGVSVSGRWLHSFENFLADVGLKPSGRHELDRFPDPHGDYEPGNVRWATDAQQMNNKRNNHRLTYGGETLTLSEWSKRTGIRPGTLSSRAARGWNDERTLTTPVRPWGGRGKAKR